MEVRRKLVLLPSRGAGKRQCTTAPGICLDEGQDELNPTLSPRAQLTFHFLSGVFLTLWVSLKSKTISLVINFHLL